MQKFQLRYMDEVTINSTSLRICANRLAPMQSPVTAYAVTALNDGMAWFMPTNISPKAMRGLFYLIH